MDSIHGSSTERVTGVGVLDRCVVLLGLLAGGPRSLRSLAEASGLPRPTAHRLLVALEAHRLVTRDGSGLFRLGSRLVELAAMAGPELDLARLAGPVLAGLHEATGESVQLYVRSGSQRLCIAAHDAGTGLRDSVPIGALLPLAAGSGGKILLAWAADAADFGIPESELAAVRAAGWASSVAEREPGVASVSAPVFASQPDGAPRLEQPNGPPLAAQPLAAPPLAAPPLAALCVSGPVSRLGPDPGRRLSAEVTAAAAELAGLLRASA